MDSTIRIAKEIIIKGEGLDREDLTYEVDPINDISKTWKLKYTQMKRTHFPYMDLPPISPFIERRLAEQHLYLSERRLYHKRKDLVLRKNNLNSQWKSLSSKEKALKENFIVFSKFLKTNLEKRERALKKFQSDSENVQKRTEDINILLTKYNCRRSDFLLMKNEIRKHSIYQSYLERVVDSAGGEFKDKDDIPKRMEVLLIAQEKLQARQAEQLSRLECSKRVMAQFMESKILQIIGLNNTIAHLQSVYDEATKHTLSMDKLAIDLKTTLINAAKDLIANEDSIRSMYHQICMMHGIAERHRMKKVLDQLLEINHSIKGYQTIYGLMRRKSKRDSRLNKQQSQVFQ